MNHEEFAKHWYEGSGFDADTERSLATAIKVNFVSREEIHELKDRLTDAIRTISNLQNNASSMGLASIVERLQGNGEGLKLALSYLAEMEAAE